MIRFATIGSNFIVPKFLEAAAKCNDLYYAAAYSRDEEKAKNFAKENGAERYYSKLDDLARAEDIDAVYIASPNAVHHSQAMLMLRHGKHVLCEKAAVSNSMELKEVINCAKENHVIFMEAMRTAYDPIMDAIECAIKKIGVVRRVSFQYFQYSSRYDKFKNGIIENAFDPKLSNGALMDIGIYCIYPLVRFFGEPEKILAGMLPLENGVDGMGNALAFYDGMIAQVAYSKITDSHLPSEIQGEEGSVLIDNIHDPNKVNIEYRNGKTEEVFARKAMNNMIYEVEKWVQCIQINQPDLIEEKRMIMELEILDEIRRQCGIIFPADERFSFVDKSKDCR